jgi:hypothetical protein
MFLRQTRWKKDGKTHSNWSVVENQRLQGGRMVQRHVLYLGEISPSQAAAWRKSIEVFDEDAGHSRTLALSRGPLRRAHARLFHRAASPVRDAAVPATAMGCVLAGWPAVGRVTAGSLLG